jgi:hypothetical protein
MLRRTYIFIILAFFQFGCVSGQSFSAVETSEGIEVSEGDRKILFYQIQPKSLEGKYERANYVHPLYSLDGTVLTEDFPSDHPHHHGVFWAWHQIIHNGKAIADGWTSENIGWEVVKSRTRKTKNHFVLDNEVLWKSVIKNSKEPIVRELSKIVIHAANANYRIIDFDIQLLALQDSLKIGGSDDAKGYGGFSWRLKLPDDIKFVNKDLEITPQVTAVQAGAWLDCVGSFDGKDQSPGGVAVFCHPSNPGHPQPWILRRERSMQNIAFPGRAPVKLTKKGIRLKYRMVIHDQNVKAEELDRLFLTYLRE